MAYGKWTQLSTPSGATAVNAMSTAGDLWKQSMQTIQGGLTAYDKGVETRLQEDSDVNTAALRRRLEGAGTLSELNAMQGDISATGLQGYGKRIDADALSQSFNKERGVMRGEFQDQFNEQISTGYANATTVDEVKAINNQVAAANEKDSWLDVSSQITQGSAGLKTALNKEAQAATDAQVQKQAGMNVAGLEAALAALVPGSLNFTENQTRITNQIAATKDKDQKLFDQGAVSSMRVASGNGIKALEAERDKLLKAAENNPNISEASVLSVFDERRPFALQKVLDNVAGSTRERMESEKAVNLTALETAKQGIPEQFRDMIGIDEMGNLTFEDGLSEQVKVGFAQKAMEAGYIGTGDSFADRNTQFNTAETSSLGEEFGSLGEQERVLANQLRQLTRDQGIELSAKATTDLATATSSADKTLDFSIARIIEDYGSSEQTYQVDPAALKAAQDAKGNAFAHMVAMGFDDNEESRAGDNQVTQNDLRKLIKDAKAANFSDAEIILAIDANTKAGNWWVDKTVNSVNFLAFLKQKPNLKKRASDLEKLVKARDVRDEDILKAQMLRSSEVAKANAGALKASGVRNTSNAVKMLNKALGIE
jgi:hypothetical protein